MAYTFRNVINENYVLAPIININPGKIMCTIIDSSDINEQCNDQQVKYKDKQGGNCTEETKVTEMNRNISLVIDEETDNKIRIGTEQLIENTNEKLDKPYKSKANSNEVSLEGGDMSPNNDMNPNKNNPIGKPIPKGGQVFDIKYDTPRSESSCCSRNKVLCTGCLII